eukprot:m.261612 g.261612  ORF g.261612 m.261612 type:complete len:290 (+) comp16219_c0_seq4:125-994(+)
MCTCYLNCLDTCTICCYDCCFAPSPKPVDDVKSSLSTGDLAIFRSNKSGRYAGTNAASASPWDHVGIVYVHDDGTPYIIDSGSFRYYPFCSRPLDFDNEGSSSWSPTGTGPQMYSLDKYLEAQSTTALGQHLEPPRKPWHYERLGFRMLKDPLTEEQKAAFKKSIEEMRDVPYEQNSAEMTSAAVDCLDCCGAFRGTEERLDSVFCSEFVAATYIKSGLLPQKPPSNEYDPAAFSVEHGCNCASVCGVCWLWWIFGRCCGCGDLYRDDGKKLFKGNVVQVKVPTPQKKK